jgi:hypothetical protein
VRASLQEAEAAQALPPEVAGALASGAEAAQASPQEAAEARAAPREVAAVPA